MDISLDHIIRNIESTSNNFDHKSCMERFRSKYSFLRHYEYIKPNIKKNDINLGDRIRYAKSIDDPISCLGLVVKIIYKKNNMVEYIVLASLQYKDSFWKLYLDMNPYFMFRYTHGMGKLTYISNRKGKDLKNIIKGTDDAIQSFDKLISADPTILGRIKWKDPLEKDIGDIDKMINEYKNNTT